MTRTTCPYCGVGCGLSVAAEGLKGDGAHPANYGRLCVKGAALGETLKLPDRLTQPMLNGKPVTWDRALDHVAGEFLRIRAEHGPDAIGFYVSGQLLTEDYYVANKLMKGFIGAANIDTNSRLCMASSVAGHIRAFGEDVVPGCYEDLEEADLVVQVGSNMAWCHPVLHQRLMAARQKRGTRIVCLDPRRTATAQTADLHLPLAPGSDVMLWLGLLVFLAEHAAVDRDWVGRHVSGFDEALAAARHAASLMEAVARATGLETGDLLAFYRLFAATERVVTLYSQGVNQSVSGSDKVNAILNCHLATGRIGRPGMGPFSLTGQPNAMGGREVGGLANQLAAHMGFTPDSVDRVRRFWNAPAMATAPGRKAVDLFDAAADGRLKAIWIAATNPADSMPRADKVRQALASVPLVIVADAWPTDTSRLAHLVLPAATWGEKDGTVTNSERRISRQRAFRAAPGLARPDWWMFAELGRRMGWDWAFAYAGPAEIFREHAALSGFENDGARLFDLGGLADIDNKAYDALAPLQWPASKGGHAPAERLFGRGGFPTSDGRARMLALAPRNEDRGEGQLTLNTGRIRDQWHTMTRTGKVARLMEHVAAPSLAIHPQDALARGICDQGLVDVQGDHAALLMRATLDPELRPGDVFAAMHWTDQFTSSGPVDRLVHALVDPVSGQPDLKGTPVMLRPRREYWRGLLFRADDDVPMLGRDVWWARAPLAKGWRVELAGANQLEDEISSEKALRRLLGIGVEAELVSYSDPRKALFRYAGFSLGVLKAAAFFAPADRGLGQTARVGVLLDQAVAPAERLALLAGVVGAAESGRVICACFGVREAQIQAAIEKQGVADLEGLGLKLKAGTNCGSCVPELKKLLMRAPAEFS